jgi:hypothetical protein
MAVDEITLILKDSYGYDQDNHKQSESSAFIVFIEKIWKKRILKNY